ncbi:glycosyltransferase [Gordonia insulae]|uniref:4,4'-diaponeurosporenoate glycosyltransferase n=1 Tax=Gordonia insulae TaxID=2420509 RepID=A0A3G8JQS1_9ACTN|nr:glycosyltransferase [Gordonia insulae]AZG46859.1 hypothetical protein D7316_03464 [Gordonia insulae]
MSVSPVVHADRRAIDRVVVVVPAHNEEELLPACLAALGIAADRVDVQVETVVVLDACTDATRHVVPPEVITIACATQSVGAARRAGFARHLDPATDGATWFATTDADSEVPADWLVTHLSSAAAGHDAFVGTIAPKSWDSWSAHTRELFDERYVTDDDHHHVHGANLGIRADWYRRIGGFSARTGDEDVELVRRLHAIRARVDRSARSPVLTSTRPDGRTDDGFAAYLRGLERQGRTAAASHRSRLTEGSR